MFVVGLIVTPARLPWRGGSWGKGKGDIFERRKNWGCGWVAISVFSMWFGLNGWDVEGLV